jgi:kynurenine formamidase
MIKATITKNNKTYTADLMQPLDISIPLREGFENVNCFYAPPVQIEPVVFGDFVGSTQKGGSLNFKNVRLNPHGNGTHTECVGHIAKKVYNLPDYLKTFHFFSKLVTLIPIAENSDRIIYKHQIEEILSPNETDALIIRTFPNDDLKMQMNHSGANPTYIHHEAMAYIVECGVEHLLVDLPSVDREEDGGKLLSHKAFWKFPDDIREKSTITELIYAPNLIKDGFFLLNIQITALELDASPSKPILYRLIEEKKVST